MGEMRDKLAGLITPFDPPAYSLEFHRRQIELWITTEDTDAFEKELYTRDDGSAVYKSLRTWDQLFGYPVRWDMPKTEAVIVG